MNKFRFICLAGLLFFAACGNNNSSTVGTYESDEESQSEDKKEDPAKERIPNTETENANTVNLDTAKNITGILKDSVTPGSKKDTNFTAEKKKVKVQKSKKVGEKL